MLLKINMVAMYLEMVTNDKSMYQIDFTKTLEVKTIFHGDPLLPEMLSDLVGGSKETRKSIWQ